MNKVRLLFLLALMALAKLSFAQLFLKVEALPSGNGSYGVYTLPCPSVLPSTNTITGSGQVTIKFPSSYSFSNLTNMAGTWVQNAIVPNPSESIGFTYVSLGFMLDNPQIIYLSGAETLLFTFKLNGSGTGAPSLIENGVDPFDQLPNSSNSNPGNELTVLDFGTQPIGLYTYTGNYVGNSPTGCASQPQDTTTVIDPPVDTTGTTDTTTVVDTTGTTDTTTVIDTTGNVDTTVIDTTDNTDTTIINPPVDTTGGTSSIHEIRAKDQFFKLFPTPAHSWLNLQFIDPEIRDGTIKLYALSGVVVEEIDKGNRSQLKLNLENMPPGLYLITFERNGKTLQRDKFIKQ